MPVHLVRVSLYYNNSSVVTAIDISTADAASQAVSELDLSYLGGWS